MRITIVGAYGYTGRLICREFQDRGWSFKVTGRNKHALDELSNEFECIETVFVSDIRRRADVLRITENSDYIVNCAGPFEQESSILIEEAAQSPVVYIDITGEVGFVKNSYKRFHETAKTNSSLLLHACAFESLVADLVIQYAARSLVDLNEIRTYYWFKNSRVSPGTRMTMKLSKYKTRYWVKEGDWATSEPPGAAVDDSIFEGKRVSIAYPLPEIAFGKWNFENASVSSHLLLLPEEAKYHSFIKEEEHSTEVILSELEKLRMRKRPGPSAEEREGQLSKILVELSSLSGQTQQILVHSTDMYLTTAKAVSLVLFELESKTGKLENYGVISPAQLFISREVEILEKLGVKLQTDVKVELKPC